MTASKKPTENVLTLTRGDAAWFIDTALSAISTDDITPVICAAHVTVTGTVAKVISTDRYRVTLANVAVESTADHEFLIPRAALIWMKKNQSVFGSYMSDQQRITITTGEDGGLAISIIDGAQIEKRTALTWRGFVVVGNFPPVERLFETARAAEHSSGARVNLDFIAKVKHLAPRHDAPTVKFTATENPNKPGPLLITFEKGDRGHREVTAEVLIQPNLELR